MAQRKRNALKHGANARQVMLWSERYEDYESLRADLRLEFSPSGSTEEYLVETLLDLRWRRRRLDCYEQITIKKRLDELREENQTSRDLENVASFASEFKEANNVEKVEAVLSRLPPGYDEAVRSRCPLEEGADPAAWGSKIGEVLARVEPVTRYEGADAFVEIFDLDFDEDLARIERLDAMIDRTIKRLMQLKTMKQMHCQLEPKLINVSAAIVTTRDGTESRITE
jgi:hypothetical protein